MSDKVFNVVSFDDLVFIKHGPETWVTRNMTIKDLKHYYEEIEKICDFDEEEAQVVSYKSIKDSMIFCEERNKVVKLSCELQRDLYEEIDLPYMICSEEY